MKKRSNNKLLILLIILFVLAIGVGYAILSSTLNFDSFISFSSITWDVGFTNVTDNGGTITSTSSITNEGKTITVNCDLGTSTDKESCIVKATITNNGSYDIGFNTKPSITYNDTYVHTVTLKWKNHEVFGNTTVLQNGFIKKGTSQDVILTIKTKFLKEEDLTSTGITIPVVVTLNFKEWQGGELPTKSDLAILKATSSTDTTAFRSDTYKEKIKIINFEDKINPPENYIESWDIGVNENTVKAYVVANEGDSNYFDLYIQSNGQLYANADMSWWFYSFINVDAINGLNLLDTSMTTNMGFMFRDTGENSSSFTIDVSNFDTSGVTDMGWMFSFIGHYSGTFHLDVSGFDTANVINMSAMFDYAACNNHSFVLDVSNFDTSKVTSMAFMFKKTGLRSEIFELDVSNFDTSNVTDMREIFLQTGYYNPTFTLDVSNFDTSKVVDMSFMFQYTGYNSSVFTLDVSGFDTMNVNNMNSMFYGVGYYSSDFTLDTSNFDTSKVTDMSYMFYNTGYNSTKFNTSITIRNPNTTTYGNMFYGVATEFPSKVTVNYTSDTSELVDNMIATKSNNSNVVKGKLVS